MTPSARPAGLFPEIGRLAPRIKDGYLYIFLDLDGTLAPIAETPDRARVPDGTREAISDIAKLDRVKVAVISGRAVKDARRVLGVNGIIYAGNHGLELYGHDADGSAWRPTLAYKKALAGIKGKLSDAAKLMPGAFVEDKGLSLCFHYRAADIGDEAARDIFKKAVDHYSGSGGVSVMYGKKAIEVRPANGWNKGRIVEWLLCRERLISRSEDITAIFIGDDVTDEDAFKALSRDGITVVVGKEAGTLARYYVDDTDQVYEFLLMILKLRKGL